MVFSELIHAAELSLAAATGQPVRLRAVWIAPDTPASHVIRVENIGSKADLPRSFIVKAANIEFPGNPQQMISMNGPRFGNSTTSTATLPYRRSSTLAPRTALAPSL